jgi:hypothetical protein
LINLVEEGTSPEDFLNVCILAKEGGKPYISSESSQIPDNATVTRRMKQELSLSELNVNRWSIISEGDVSIDLDSPTIEELNEKFANKDYAIDFKYEENIDNVLDPEVTFRNCTLHMLLDCHNHQQQWLCFLLPQNHFQNVLHCRILM